VFGKTTHKTKNARTIARFYCLCGSVLVSICLLTLTLFVFPAETLAAKMEKASDAKDAKKPKKSKSKKKNPTGKIVVTLFNEKTGECKIQGEGKRFQIGQPVKIIWKEGELYPKNAVGRVSEVVVGDLLFATFEHLSKEDCTRVFGKSFRGLDYTAPLNLSDSVLPSASVELEAGLESPSMVGLDTLNPESDRNLGTVLSAGLNVRVFPFKLAHISHFGLSHIGFQLSASAGRGVSEFQASLDSKGRVDQKISLSGGLVAVLPLLRNRFLLELAYLPFATDTYELKESNLGSAGVFPMRNFHAQGQRAHFVSQFAIFPFWLLYAGGSYGFASQIKATTFNDEEVVKLELARLNADPAAARSPRSFHADESLADPVFWSALFGTSLNFRYFGLRFDAQYQHWSAKLKSYDLKKQALLYSHKAEVQNYSLNVGILYAL
jgi:hypothetical protein